MKVWTSEIFGELLSHNRSKFQIPIWERIFIVKNSYILILLIKQLQVRITTIVWNVQLLGRGCLHRTSGKWGRGGGFEMNTFVQTPTSTLLPYYGKSYGKS